MPKLRTSRLAINYQRMGSGPDVVMVHGLAANLAFWYLKILPPFTPHYTVTAYDLRGHGGSETPPDHYTTGDLAEDLLALLDGLQIRRAHLVGHSIGGAVCLHFATRYPERVHTLTLCECRLHAYQPIKSTDNEAFWERHAREFEAKGVIIPRNTPKVFYSLMEELSPLAEHGAVNPNSVPGLIAKSGQWDPQSRAAQRWLNLVSTTTFATDLQQVAGLTDEAVRTVRAPVQLLYGAQSPFIETCHHLERALPQAEATVYPDQGHFFPIARPDLIAPPTLAFLARHPAA